MTADQGFGSRYGKANCGGALCWYTKRMIELAIGHADKTNNHMHHFVALEIIDIPPMLAAAHFFFFSYFATSGSAITCNNCSITSSLDLPSACAWKFVLIRWRSTGIATFLMSSIATLKRPSMAAMA